MSALIVALMTWISVATGLPVPDALPEISYATQAEINIISETKGIVAYYTRETKVIVLNKDWDENSVKDVSILVHELTHYMAHLNDITYYCRGESERIPYEMQKQFLAEHGKDLFTVFNINPTFYLIMINCGDLR